MNNKPILYSYFKKTADVLLSEYNRLKEQSSSANLGKNREYFCKEFLSKALPPKLSIKSGEIWDSQKNKTGQLDVVILRDDGPSLHIGSDDIYLAEGVFCVIEVKSNLIREKVVEAGETLTKVASLKINVGAQISTGAKLNRPLRIIFAYEGATWDTIIDELNKNSWTEIFDLICILDCGILLKKGHYLPQFYLRYFTENNSFFEYDIKNGKITKKSPYGSAWEPFYYAFRDIHGMKNISIEDKILSLNENKASVAINKIVDGIPLSDQDLVEFMIFMSILKFRVPKFREYIIKKKLEKYKKDFFKEFQNEGSREKFIKKFNKSRGHDSGITVQ